MSQNIATSDSKATFAGSPSASSGGTTSKPHSAVLIRRTKRTRQRLHSLPEDPDAGTSLFLDDEDDDVFCAPSYNHNASSFLLSGPGDYEAGRQEDGNNSNSTEQKIIETAKGTTTTVENTTATGILIEEEEEVIEPFDEDEIELLPPDLESEGARVEELSSILKSQRPSFNFAVSPTPVTSASVNYGEVNDDDGDDVHSRLGPLHALTQHQLLSLPLGTQAFVSAVNNSNITRSSVASTSTTATFGPRSSTHIHPSELQAETTPQRCTPGKGNDHTKTSSSSPSILRTTTTTPTDVHQHHPSSKSTMTTPKRSSRGRVSVQSGIRLSFDDGVVASQQQSKPQQSGHQLQLSSAPSIPFPRRTELTKIENHHKIEEMSVIPKVIDHPENRNDELERKKASQIRTARRLLKVYKHAYFIDYLGNAHPSPFTLTNDLKLDDSETAATTESNSATSTSTINFPPLQPRNKRNGSSSSIGTASWPTPPTLWCPWNRLSETPLTLSGWGLPDAVTNVYASMGITALHPWQRACLFEYLQQLQTHDNDVWLRMTASGRKWLSLTTSTHTTPSHPTSTSLLYSARTGGGKTLVAELIMFRTLLRNEQTFYPSDAAASIENFHGKDPRRRFHYMEHIQQDAKKFRDAVRWLTTAPVPSSSPPSTTSAFNIQDLKKLLISRNSAEEQDDDDMSSSSSLSSSSSSDGDGGGIRDGIREDEEERESGNNFSSRGKHPPSSSPLHLTSTSTSTSSPTTQDTTSQGVPILDPLLGTKVMFIVPYVAIAEEKSSVFTKVAAAIGKKVRCHARNKGQRSLSDDIHVCTMEKANVLINLFLERGRTGELGLVVVDEIHQVRDAERGYILELLLTKLVELSSSNTTRQVEGEAANRPETENEAVVNYITTGHDNAGVDDEVQALVRKHAQKQSDRVHEQRRLMLVGMSATLSNAPSLAKWMNDALFFATDYRPVPLTERFVLNHHVFRPPLASSSVSSSSTTTSSAALLATLPDRVLDGTSFLQNEQQRHHKAEGNPPTTTGTGCNNNSATVATVWKGVVMDYFHRGLDISSIKIPASNTTLQQHPSLFLPLPPKKGAAVVGNYQSSNNKWYQEQRSIDRDLQHLALEGCHQGFQLLVFCPSRVSCEQTALMLSEGAALLFGADPRRWGEEVKQQQQHDIEIDKASGNNSDASPKLEQQQQLPIPPSPSQPHPQIFAAISKRIELVKALRALAVGDYGKIKLTVSNVANSAPPVVSLKLVTAEQSAAADQQKVLAPPPSMVNTTPLSGIPSSSAAIARMDSNPVSQSLYISIINYGVAFHHAGLTSEQRALIEDAFRNRVVWVICCTTTLATGVNLPARRVIFKTIKMANQTIDSTRYHQAAGRAGRQGYDTTGEVYVLGRQVERTAILRVMSPVLPPLESNFSAHKRGMVRVLLEGFSTKTIKTVYDIKHCVERTLLAAASPPTIPPTASATTTTESSLQQPPYQPPPPPTSNLEEVFATTKNALDFLECNRFIEWDASLDIFVSTALGEATVASSLAPDEALLLYEDLSHARSSVCLENDLHLLFLCTPYYHGLEPDWSRFLPEFLNGSSLRLSDGSVRHVMTLIGVDFGFLHQCSVIPPPRGAGILTLGEISASDKQQQNNTSTTAVNMSAAVQKRLLLLHRRLYLTLVLWDVINEVPPSVISRKFGNSVSTGELRRLRDLSSTFSNMAANFCDKLNWWQLPPLLERIATRLSKGVEADLLPLMGIEGLTPSRARELAKKGFRTPLAVASASVVELESILSDSVQFAGAMIGHKQQQESNSVFASNNNHSVSEYPHQPGEESENSRAEQLSKLCNASTLSSLATTSTAAGSSSLTKRNLARCLIEGARAVLLAEASEIAESLQNVSSIGGGGGGGLDHPLSSMPLTTSLNAFSSSFGGAMSSSFGGGVGGGSWSGPLLSSTSSSLTPHQQQKHHMIMMSPSSASLLSASSPHSSLGSLFPSSASLDFRAGSSSSSAEGATWVAIDAKIPAQWSKFLKCISLVRGGGINHDACVDSKDDNKSTTSRCWSGNSSEWIQKGPFISLLAITPSSHRHPSASFSTDLGGSHQDIAFCVQGRFSIITTNSSGNHCSPSTITYNLAATTTPLASTIFYIQNASSKTEIDTEEDQQSSTKDNSLLDVAETEDYQSGLPQPIPPIADRRIRHIPCEAMSSFLSHTFFPSPHFAKILPDSKNTVLALRSAGLLPRSVGDYPRIFFSAGCGPTVDPYIADWLLSPEDRSSYRSPPIGQLCAAHGVPPNSQARLNTPLATWLLDIKTLPHKQQLPVDGFPAPTTTSLSSSHSSVSKGLKRYLKHISNQCALSTLESNCALSISCLNVMLALLRKLDSLSMHNGGTTTHTNLHLDNNNATSTSKASSINFECQVRCLVQLEMPTVLCLVQMEAHGIGFDHTYYESLLRLMDRRRVEIEEEAYSAAGVSNWDLTSPKDCARVLYDVLKMPSLERTFETKYLPKRLHGSAAKGRGRGANIMRETRSTKQSVLKSLQRMFPENPLPTLLMEHRTMVGWSEKYLHAILHLSKISTSTSSRFFRRIHGTFLQTSTATGRLTMEDPNLQTIPHPITFKFTRPPADTIDVALRRAFIAQPFQLTDTHRSSSSSPTAPPKQHVTCSICSKSSITHTSRKLGVKSSLDGESIILSVDYGQIEARLLAHFSQDEKLIEVFKRCSGMGGSGGSGETPLDIFEELARQIQERVLAPKRTTPSASTTNKNQKGSKAKNFTTPLPIKQTSVVVTADNDDVNFIKEPVGRRPVNSRENPLARRVVASIEEDSSVVFVDTIGQKRPRDDGGGGEEEGNHEDGYKVPGVVVGTNQVETPPARPPITPDQRKAAKTLCYGMIYGKGANAIAEDLELEINEAKDLLSDFRATYKTATTFIESVGSASSSDGFVRTITGRKRWLPYASSNNQRHKSASDRMSINTMCQGSAADVMKLAMINLVSIPPTTTANKQKNTLPTTSCGADDFEVASGQDTMLAERVACAECLRLGLIPHQDLLFGTFPPARLILQIHDELLFEVNAAFVPSLCRVLRSVMDVSQVLQLRVPLDVRITVGPNYEDMSLAAF